MSTQRMQTGSNSLEVYLEKTLAAAGNYSAEDVMSEDASSGTSWKFDDMAPYNGGGGVITKAILLCETTGLKFEATLYLFSIIPTSVLNDRVANTAVKTSDKEEYIGRIDFPAMEDLGGNSEAIATPSTVGNLPTEYICAPGDKAIYGVLVARTAEANEASGMKMLIKLTGRMDD